jgi:carbohydrate-selective porin OprB
VRRKRASLPLNVLWEGEVPVKCLRGLERQGPWLSEEGQWELFEVIAAIAAAQGLVGGVTAVQGSVDYFMVSTQKKSDGSEYQGGRGIGWQ